MLVAKHVRAAMAHVVKLARMPQEQAEPAAQDHIPEAGEMVGAELPPLPEPKHRGIESAGSYFDSYTAAQMQAYARAALSAPASAELQDEQAAFEKWAASASKTFILDRCARGYDDWMTDWAWKAWQARAALSAQAVPQDERDKVDAERYRLLRPGRRWSVIDGLGDVLCSEQLDVAIDTVNAAIAARKGGAT